MELLGFDHSIVIFINRIFPIGLLKSFEESASWSFRLCVQLGLTNCIVTIRCSFLFFSINLFCVSHIGQFCRLRLELLFVALDL